jgi:hypothetical protein
MLTEEERDKKKREFSFQPSTSYSHANRLSDILSPTKMIHLLVNRLYNIIFPFIHPTWQNNMIFVLPTSGICITHKQCSVETLPKAP